MRRTWAPGHRPDSRFADPRLEPRCRRGIELPAHQVGRRLEHDHVEAQPAQGVRRFEAEQAPADDDGAARALRPTAQAEKVVEGAIDEHAVVVRTLDGGYERRRPGRQNQAVVTDLGAARRANTLPFAVYGKPPGCR